jgi:hypothetical protein
MEGTQARTRVCVCDTLWPHFINTVKSNPTTGLDSATGFQEVEAPRV